MEVVHKCTFFPLSIPLTRLGILIDSKDTCPKQHKDAAPCKNRGSVPYLSVLMGMSGVVLYEPPLDRLPLSKAAMVQYVSTNSGGVLLVDRKSTTRAVLCKLELIEIGEFVTSTNSTISCSKLTYTTFLMTWLSQQQPSFRQLPMKTRGEQSKVSPLTGTG